MCPVSPQDMTCCSRLLLPRYVHHHSHSRALWGRCFSVCFMCAACHTAFLLTPLQWLSALDSCAQGRFKLCSHAAWIVFTPRSPEAIHTFLSHLGRRWNSIDYIDYDIVGYGRLLCFVPSDRRVAVRRKCLWFNSRHFPKSCS